MRFPAGSKAESSGSCRRTTSLEETLATSAIHKPAPSPMSLSRLPFAPAPALRLRCATAMCFDSTWSNRSTAPSSGTAASTTSASSANCAPARRRGDILARGRDRGPAGRRAQGKRRRSRQAARRSRRSLLHITRSYRWLWGRSPVAPARTPLTVDLCNWEEFNRGVGAARLTSLTGAVAVVTLARLARNRGEGTPPTAAASKLAGDQWLAATLEEYRALRGEVTTSIAAQQSILSFGTATLALVFGPGLGLWEKSPVSVVTLFNVLIPLLSGMILVIWWGEVLRMGSCRLRSSGPREPRPAVRRRAWMARPRAQMGGRSPRRQARISSHVWPWKCSTSIHSRIARGP